MKFLAVASALFLGALAVPTTQCGECEKHQHEHSGESYPVGNNPGNHGGNYPGGNSGYPGYPGGNVPGGGNNPGYPGGKPGYPGGNTPGHPGGNVPGGNTPGGNTPGGTTPGGPGGNNPGGNGNTPGGGNNPGGNGNTPGGGNNPGGNGNTPGGNTPGAGAAYDACTSQLYSNTQCCSVDVLGLLGLDCANPTSKPTSATDFEATCSKAGKQARCCLLPVAGQDVLCVKPTGVY